MKLLQLLHWRLEQRNKQLEIKSIAYSEALQYRQDHVINLQHTHIQTIVYNTLQNFFKVHGLIAFRLSQVVQIVPSLWFIDLCFRMSHPNVWSHHTYTHCFNGHSSRWTWISRFPLASLFLLSPLSNPCILSSIPSCPSQTWERMAGRKRI